MKLRLYHHHDGARVAYREAGTGRPLALLHSKLLSHREWEPVVEELSHRYRLVLPDLPLHGDSEDRPHPPAPPPPRRPRGPPDPRLHAAVARRGDGRVRARHVRVAPAGGRARGGCADP